MAARMLAVTIRDSTVANPLRVLPAGPKYVCHHGPGESTDKDYRIVHWLDSYFGWRYAPTEDNIVAYYARDRK